MQLRPATTAVALVVSVVCLFSVAQGHNITRLLAKHPEFSTFNRYLGLTHLAAEINDRTTITVCAVDNAAMSALLAKHLSIYSIKNILSLHVLLDYFGAKKLHQITNGTALAATMFQATGSAPGSAGFVNITDLKGGKVGFTPEDNDGSFPAQFVKSVEEIPYNISVIHISAVLLRGRRGSDAGPGRGQPHRDHVGPRLQGLRRDAVGESRRGEDLRRERRRRADGVLPRRRRFQGVPAQSNNGLMNTLATNGAEKYDFTVQNDGQAVTLKNKVVTAKIIGTLLDEQPLAIYTINKVLTPKELYKGAPTPAPAPAPDKAADAPKSSKDDALSPDANSPADSPDADPADQTADDNNGAVALGRVGFGGLILSVWLGFSLL
ncbi:hypothetical protein M0R45_016451 [Rubus argutus]|uniref:FAS1 domain-containing protein n=1 Tax=Rubus argutus TaxID=59490 RepID=A0AAW1XSJ2_RUBAR